MIGTPISLDGYRSAAGRRMSAFRRRPVSGQWADAPSGQPRSEAHALATPAPSWHEVAKKWRCLMADRTAGPVDALRPPAAGALVQLTQEDRP
jgi:hypothetical protein